MKYHNDALMRKQSYQQHTAWFHETEILPHKFAPLHGRSNKLT